MGRCTYSRIRGGVVGGCREDSKKEVFTFERNSKCAENFSVNSGPTFLASRSCDPSRYLEMEVEMRENN